jgi:hypothetical protein
MPSDPAGTHPSGVLVRPAPDFFDDHLCQGGFIYSTDPITNLNWVSISLFNDANSGVALKVYGLTYGDDSGFGTIAYYRQGPPLGSFVSEGINVRADLGGPYGQIWQRLDIAPHTFAIYNLPLPPTVVNLGNPGFNANTILSPFPLFIIPVGWSLVIANRLPTGIVQASFWYQQANE